MTWMWVAVGFWLATLFAYTGWRFARAWHREQARIERLIAEHGRERACQPKATKGDSTP